MARTAGGWGWYANINDDVRHQLIDRAWFGQYHRDHAFEQDVARMQAEADALYGAPLEATIDPEFDASEPAIDEFYHQGQAAGADMADLYGPSAQAEAQPEPEAGA